MLNFTTTMYIVETTNIVFSLFLCIYCIDAFTFRDEILATTKRVTLRHGHYPSIFCGIRKVVFDPVEREFLYGGSVKDVDKVEQCDEITDIWPLLHVSDIEKFHCDQTYDLGYAFAFFYWYGQSNYYHVHYDTMIPLFRELHYYKNVKNDNGSILLMPTVESSRLEILSWDHDAFSQGNQYWVDMIKLMKGKRNATLFPLHESFLDTNKLLCFKEVYFGTPHVNFADSDLILDFIRFVKDELNITDTEPAEERMALVSRTGRRRILNEEEIAEHLKDIIPVDIIRLEKMTFRQQVEAMQKYTIFAAMNGAGLMNALYLPWYAVAIQMVPYKAELNENQYEELLQNRGPTIRWRNENSKLHSPNPDDEYNMNSDTTVDLESFKSTVEHALKMARNTRIKGYDKPREEL